MILARSLHAKSLRGYVLKIGRFAEIVPNPSLNLEKQKTVSHRVFLDVMLNFTKNARFLCGLIL